MKQRNTLLSVLLVALIQIPLLMPFFHRGLFLSLDNIQFERIFEMFQSMKYGGFPSYWSSGLLYGYGYPLFTFYSPLIYIFGAGLAFAGINFILATKIIFMAGFVLGAVGIYFLAKQLFEKDFPAIVSAVAFSLAPYRAVDVYVRGALAEFIGFSLIPWILCLNIAYWKNRTAKVQTRIWWGLTALLAILILCHNLSALMVLFILIPLNIFFACRDKKSSQKKFRGILISGVSALLLSSFYWVPILFEKNLVRLGIFGSFPYHEYFIDWKQLWNAPWGFLGANLVGGMSLRIGKILLITSLVAIVLNNLVKTKVRGLINYFFVSAVFFLFFETTLSWSIWGKINFLHYLQFPWRLHTVITICLCVLSGAAVFLLDKRNKWIAIAGGIMLIAGSFVENFSYYNQARYSDEPVMSETTTWDDEYLPLWVTKKPNGYAPDKIWISSGSGTISNISWGYLSKDFTVESTTGAEITIAHIYYPGWKVSVNGENAKINYDNKQGLMQTRIGQGESTVKYIFTKTWYRRLSLIISLSSLVIIIGLVLIKKK